MEPIIMVVSESKMFLGWTYPKRAKGLIKKGRAFWLPECENEVLVLKHEKDEDNDGNKNRIRILRVNHKRSDHEEERNNEG